MRSSFNKKQINKEIKSLDINRSIKIKRMLKKKKKLNRSVINKRISLNEDKTKDTGMCKEQDEISLLSNANLNIIKILNSCANEEILNDSSFITIKDRHNNKKEKSVESISKLSPQLRNRSCAFSPIPGFKKSKNKNITKNNNFYLNSNISGISSETLSDKRFNDSIRTQSKFKKLNENEKEIILTHNNTYSNNKTKKKIKKIRHLSQVNLTKYTLNNLNGAGSKAKEKKTNINDKDNTNSKIDSNKNSLDKKYPNHSQKRSRSKSIIFRETNCLSKRMDILANINISNFSESPLVNNKCMKGFLNEIEIMKINENIHNDINFIYLKKKISQSKKNIQNKNSKEFSKFKSNMSPSHSKTNSSLNKKLNVPGKKIDKINTIEKRDENNEIILGKEDKENNINNNIEANNENSKKNLMSLSKNSTKKTSNYKDKYRLLIRRKHLYDSFDDDEEYKEEEIDYYIAPDSWYIRLFDFFLFISSI